MSVEHGFSVFAHNVRAEALALLALAGLLPRIAAPLAASEAL
jgi:hypothetical protein